MASDPKTYKMCLQLGCFNEMIRFSFFMQRAMAETFYLSNIVPQNYENNAGFWNRWEITYKELTKWKISGYL